MTSRTLKEWYYRLTWLPLKLNAWVYRRFRAPRFGTVKVHLGPGQEHYLDGWVNLDANFITARIDVWANILDGLPFRDGTVDAFYSHHVIEHLPDTFLGEHFAEMWRCLKPGGMIRIGVPNGDAAIERFLQNDHEWFGDFPDSRSSIGGRFVNFAFCRGEHLSLLTASYLSELATNAGFDNLHFCKPIAETRFPEFIDQNLLENEFESTVDIPHTLILEAGKPHRLLKSTTAAHSGFAPHGIHASGTTRADERSAGDIRETVRQGAGTTHPVSAEISTR